MIEKLQEVIEQMTVAYNIGEAFLTNDDEAQISHFIPLLIDSIEELQDIVDEYQKPRIGRKYIR